jgi:hypothetical protein
MDAALRAFYAADPRRGPSCERDLGLRWRSAQGATYRVAWIEDTEELYSVRHSGAGEPTTVVVLARLGAEALERILAGWRSVLGTDRPGSYEWLLDRAASARHEAAPAF